MTPRDVVRAAALIAARHAWPALPASLVRWQDEARSQGEGDVPHVTLSSISHVPEAPVSRVRMLRPDGVLLEQTYIWTVQVKADGWRLDSTESNNPVLFAHRMRFGWYLETVRIALLDKDSPVSEPLEPGWPETARCPIKLVDEVGQVLTLNQRVRGHTLPVLAFELELRYLALDFDPTPVDEIESVVLGGALGGVDATLSTES